MSSNPIKIFTIGFTQKRASEFFQKLSSSGVKKIIDTRLNNVSQLAGFAKKDDLKYFLDKVCNITYEHKVDLAPTKDMLDEFKKVTHDWSKYEDKFIDLIRRREIEKKILPADLDNSCLLCSEHLPHYCHRRLVAEYLKSKWGNVEIVHLK